MPVPIGSGPSRRNVKVKREGSRAVFARHAVPRLARAFHNFLTEEAVTLDRVLVPFAARDLILTEANHADSRAESLRVLYRTSGAARKDHRDIEQSGRHRS